MLRQNNEHNKLSLRKIAISLKALSGMAQLGTTIYEAVRVGTETHKNAVTEEVLTEYKAIVAMLR